MPKAIVASLIVGAAIVGAVALYVYFSPYQSCVRAQKKGYLVESTEAEIYAADKCASVR
jgi:hypothetical protein